MEKKILVAHPDKRVAEFYASIIRDDMKLSVYEAVDDPKSLESAIVDPIVQGVVISSQFKRTGEDGNIKKILDEFKIPYVILADNEMIEYDNFRKMVDGLYHDMGKKPGFSYSELWLNEPIAFN